MPITENTLKEKNITKVELAEKLEITRATLYKRLEDQKWKKHQLSILSKLGLTS